MTSTPHPGEAHATTGLQGRLNWLRAGVLGANDGIISTATLVVGVASATPAVGPIALAGVAGLVGGAISMALGEYVSVSSQRDSETALIAKEERELSEMPEEELAELEGLYREKGLSESTARLVAAELTAHNALEAHLDAELGIDREDVANPWTAAFASAISFTIGAALPLAAILLFPGTIRIPATFAVVLVALALTGMIGAKLGESPVARSTIRVVIGGTLALLVTYGIGSLLGVSGVGA